MQVFSASVTGKAWCAININFHVYNILVHEHMCNIIHVYMIVNMCACFRMCEGHLAMDAGFSREAAAALAVRGSTEVAGTGYQFTRDLRLKAVRTPHTCTVCTSMATQCYFLYMYMYFTVLLCTSAVVGLFFFSYVHVHGVYVYVYMHAYTCIHVLMRDEKEKRKKQARSNKQTKQSNTAQAVTFLT